MDSTAGLSLKGTVKEYGKVLTRRPRKFAELRTCGESNCTVRLSSYNRGPFCYAHSDLNYGRIRGKKG